MFIVKHEIIKAENSSVVKINLLFDKIFDTCFLDIDGAEILATTCGSIKNNAVFLEKAHKEIDVYVTFSSKIYINATINIGINSHKYSSEIANSIVNLKSEADVPIIFTANKGLDFFLNRISSSNLIKDCQFRLVEEDDIKVHISGKRRKLLVCIGEDGGQLTSSDIVFHIDSNEETINIPKELLVNRFYGKKISLFMLVKADFHKKINNIYYKSKISNDLEISENINNRSISDFSDPTGEKLDPTMWIIDKKSQLPTLI